MKSKEQFETYDAELHKDDFFYIKQARKEEEEERATAFELSSAATPAFDEATSFVACVYAHARGKWKHEEDERK
jgi:hypothetical protein